MDATWTPRGIATVHFVSVYFLSDLHGESISLHTVTLYYFKLKAPLLMADVVG